MDDNEGKENRSIEKIREQSSRLNNIFVNSFLIKKDLGH